MLRQAMREGAVGFSTSQLDIHADHEANRAAQPRRADELIALSTVLGEFDQGIIEFLPVTGSDATRRDRALRERCARSANR